MIKKTDLKTYIEILDVYNKRSTCARVHVATLLVKDGRVNMTGWNGVPSGFKHCTEFFTESGIDVSTVEGRDLHRLFSERFELHGEMNVIAQCAKHGISTGDCALVQHVSPCLSCAKLIISSGIKAVYFRQLYDRNDDNGLSLLIKAGVSVFKLDDEGDVIQFNLTDVYKPLVLNGIEYLP